MILSEEILIGTSIYFGNIVSVSRIIRLNYYFSLKKKKQSCVVSWSDSASMAKTVDVLMSLKT